MKCNGSPTTSTAVSLDAHASDRDDVARREATEAFERVVASMIVKPVADAMGPMGGMFGDVVARAAIGRRGDAT